MIEIINAAALATVQDLGRHGSLGYGVGTSGAMDTLSLQLGNLLLGNDLGAAAIEIPLFPFEVRFVEDCTFAITGAECGARLDGQRLPPNWATHARKGQVLALNYPSRGSRAYLCLAGGVDVPLVLGSRSTQLRGGFGGWQGRTLVCGDIIPAGRLGHGQAADMGAESALSALPLTLDELPAIRVLPAAEFECFSAQARDRFFAGEWKITTQSNRYGYRMEGTPLLPEQPFEVRSHGIVPGVIQVPHGGQPIVQMRDAQPSGGYPKFATVIEADLWRLGQAAIGSKVRFVACTYAEALEALQANQAFIERTRQQLALRS
ncbi:5-oxoprolinase subunit C family protein [Pseudomonas sp. X10]